MPKWKTLLPMFLNTSPLFCCLFFFCLYGLEFSISWNSCFFHTPWVFISFTYWNWCQTCVAWSTAAIKCKLNQFCSTLVCITTQWLKMPSVLKNLSHWTSQPGTAVCDLHGRGRKQLILSSEHSLPDPKYVGDTILAFPPCGLFHRYGKGPFRRPFINGVFHATRN